MAILNMKRNGAAFAVVLALMASAGCSKVNKENYDKLKMGMDYKEVVALLGEPAQCDSLLMAKNCTWGSGEKKITIQIVADKVALFQSEGL